MALKELLTDLTQGLDSYPNHNTPSTAGGFNYGGSTSVFDSKTFNQRSMGYADKFTSQDNPTPLIPQILPGVNEGPASSILFLEDSPDGFIRGGAVNSVIRTAVDSVRMNKFLLTPEGGTFVNTQTYLQTTNPMIQEGGKGFGAAIDSISQFIFGADLGFGTGDNGTNRNFNINNILKQVESNYLGVHYDRAGNKPVFEDEYKYFKQHGSGKQFDADTIGKFSRTEGLEKGNRLLTLAQKFHSGIDAVSARSVGSLMAQSNPMGIDLGNVLDMFDSLVSGFKNLNNDPLGALGGKYTEDNVLYQYHGGPNSIYGAGSTILYRYDNTNFDSQNYWSTHVSNPGSTSGDYGLFDVVTNAANDALFGGLPIFGSNGLFFDGSGEIIGENAGNVLESMGRNVFGNDLVDLVTGQWENPLLGGPNNFNISVDIEDPTSLLIHDHTLRNFSNGERYSGTGATSVGNRWKAIGNNTLKNYFTGPILSGHYFDLEGKKFIGPQTGYITDANTDQIRDPKGPTTITPTGQAKAREKAGNFYVFSDLGGYWSSHNQVNNSNGFGSPDFGDPYALRYDSFLIPSLKQRSSDSFFGIYGEESPHLSNKDYFTGDHYVRQHYGDEIANQTIFLGPQTGYIKSKVRFVDISLSDYIRKEGDKDITDITPSGVVKHIGGDKGDDPLIYHQPENIRTALLQDQRYRPNSFKKLQEEGADMFDSSADHYLSSIGGDPSDESRGGSPFFRRERRVNTGDQGTRFATWKMDHSADGPQGTMDEINSLDITKVTDGDFSDQKFRDFCRFRFEVVNSSRPIETQAIVFRAFLDNFNDNYNANWNSFKYNGRGEEFYTYDSFKRTFDISFKISAATRGEMKNLYRKLNYLVSTLAPEYSADSNRMKGTYIRLSVGAYMDRTPGFLTSMNIKWNQDYPWEIAMSMPKDLGSNNIISPGDKKQANDKDMHVLPHILDVSCNFTPIHDFVPKTSIEASPFIIPGANSPLHKPTGEQRKWLKGESQATTINTEQVEKEDKQYYYDEKGNLVEGNQNIIKFPENSGNKFNFRDPLFDYNYDFLYDR